ncbi:UPF0228 family protein [Methanosarcina sp. UBA411]|jgi:hypothetical protein|uniref:UPF0228 family protein n=1 Tax=Methanosarcina sp. UBA411 TaxID=1915589 RepID=UPI0025F9500C|nr:UPF0228 family protein [Methanosarcina sp. UBA411]
MNKGNKKITFFIVFLISIVLIELFVKMTIFTPTITPHEGNIGGLVVQFREGVTKTEAKNILENYNLTMYYVDYNYYAMPDTYYIVVDKDKVVDVRNELEKIESWTNYTTSIEKGNYCIITVPDQTINDKNFIKILNKHNLQVKTFVYCHIRFGEHPLSGISEERADKYVSELEMNENIFTVYIESFQS